MKANSTAWKHIKRSPYQTLAAVLTMFLTFLVCGMFLLTTVVSVLILNYFESKPQVTVFFSETAGKAEATELKNQLEASGKTASVRYVSKEDALEIYKEQNKDDPLLLEMVTADILPASLEVTATDPRFLKELEPMMKEGGGVEEVVFQKDVVDALLSWTNAIRLVGGILGALLIFDALLIVMTVISMKVALKKEEVEVLKLIGASQWYIRMPFLLEGGWYGICGAFLAWLVISIIILIFRSSILSFLGIIPIVQTILKNPLSLHFLGAEGIFLAAIVGTGFFLGALGSYIALGKYIKY